VIGTSHRRTNTPCQDRTACQVLPGGALIAAVADGAGSAAMSGRGAEIAVRTVLAELGQRLGTGESDVRVHLREAAARARAAIVEEAILEEAALRDYASTLLVAVVSPYGDGALQIGDGVIAVNAENEWCWVFWPQRGEYANTTRFLTDDDAIDSIQVEELRQGVIDIALMSDGLEPLALHYATQTVYSPFFNGIIQPLQNTPGCGEIGTLSRSLEQFLSSNRVAARADDDLSLILATRRN
jgi:Protein phosphatase 2C